MTNNERTAELVSTLQRLHLTAKEAATGYEHRPLLAQHYDGRASAFAEMIDLVLLMNRSEGRPLIDVLADES